MLGSPGVQGYAGSGRALALEQHSASGFQLFRGSGNNSSQACLSKSGNVIRSASPQLNNAIRALFHRGGAPKAPLSVLEVPKLLDPKIGLC